MSEKIGCALFFLLLATSLPVEAQERGVDFQQSLFTVEKGITTEQGLPANGVNSLLQDSEGYIWAATYNGLARYDGYKLKVFDSSNIPELESNRFLGVSEDSEGRIWAGLEYNNLIMMDEDSIEVFKITEEETGFNTHISEIAFSPGGKIWVGTNNGLLIFQDGVFTRLSELGSETVQKVIYDSGYVYVLFSTKLCRLYEDGSLDKELITKDETGTVDISGEKISTLDSTVENLSDLDVKNGKVRVLSYKRMIQIDFGGTSYTRLLKNTELGQESMYGFLSMGEKLLIYGSDGLSEITNFNAGTGSLHVTGYAGYHLRHAILDHEGSLWLATTAKGLRQLISTPVYQGHNFDILSGKTVTAIMKGSDNTLYTGTNCDGLYAFKDNEFYRYGENEGILNTCVWSIMEQRDGTLWAGTWGKGVFYRRPGEQIFHPYEPPLMDDANAVLSVYEDSHGNIWFGSYYNGLFKKTGDTVKRVLDEDGQMLPSIRTFYEDEEGKIWAATDRGVGYIQGDEFEVPPELEMLKTINIRTINKDKEGRFWFGSYGEGLYAYLPGEKPIRITRQQGLYDNTVSQFGIDAGENIWLAGNMGVFFIEKAQIESFLAGETDQLRVSKLGVHKGLPTRETAGGFMPSSYLDNSGVLYIPTVQGMAVIHTDKLKLNRNIPAVKINEIVLNGNSVVPEQARDISYNNQRIVFEFNALSFINSDYVTYRYKLNGFDGDWQLVDNTPQAVYTSLSPGEYTFHVIASNDDGFWNNEGAQFSFVIKPPFWETTWFYLMSVLFLIGTVMGIVSYRTRLLRLRKEELEEQVAKQTTTIRHEKERLEEAYSELEISKRQVEESKQIIEEQDEIKSRFFANISYELRTPLTFVKGMIQQAIEGKYGEFGEKLAREFNAMMTHTNRLQTQVDYLLELSNIEIGEVDFNPRFYDLNAQISLMEELFDNWARQNHIHFEFEAAAQPLYIHADSEKMGRILTSAFSKAMQFTSKGGWIIIKTSASEDGEKKEVRISISSKAEQLSEKERKLMFDRFYYQSRVPGIPFHVGLALAKEWLEVHNGEILVKESPEQDIIEICILMPRADKEAASQAEYSIPDLKIPTEGNYEQESRNGEQKKKQGAPNPNNKSTILLIDHNSLSRQYIREMLKGSYHIAEARDGEEALDMILKDELTVDLIVSEVLLSGIDGNELSSKLRKNSKTYTIPVVLLTAKTGDDNYLAGLRSGADAYITKPFKESVLKETLKNLISNRHFLMKKLRDDQNIQQLISEHEESFLLIKLDKIIDDNIDNADLTIDDIANQLYIGQRQLQRRIKDQTGLTPKQYLRKRRLNVARLLIDQDYGTISEVAFATGFNSPSLFSSYFKDEFGESPSEWNKSDK